MIDEIKPKRSVKDLIKKWSSLSGATPSDPPARTVVPTPIEKVVVVLTPMEKVETVEKKIDNSELVSLSESAKILENCAIMLASVEPNCSDEQKMDDTMILDARQLTSTIEVIRNGDVDPKICQQMIQLYDSIIERATHLKNLMIKKSNP